MESERKEEFCLAYLQVGRELHWDGEELLRLDHVVLAKVGQQALVVNLQAVGLLDHLINRGLCLLNKGVRESELRTNRKKKKKQKNKNKKQRKRKARRGYFHDGGKLVRSIGAGLQ